MQRASKTRMRVGYGNASKYPYLLKVVNAAGDGLWDKLISQCPDSP